VRGAIGFSAFAVLLYYAVTNASAWTLRTDSRRFGRTVAASGLVGCLLLAFTLPVASVAAGSMVMLVGVSWWVARSGPFRR
jgi:APA family basic amino acid/polyamine antiporter